MIDEFIEHSGRRMFNFTKREELTFVIARILRDNWSKQGSIVVILPIEGECACHRSIGHAFVTLGGKTGTVLDDAEYLAGLHPDINNVVQHYRKGERNAL